MTDMTALLAPVKARTEKATEGPWEHRSHGTGIRGGGSYDFIVHPVVGIIAERSPSGTSADAAFIAAARTDVPRLVAALEAVAGLHQPQEEDQLWCILDEECEECYPESGDGTGHAMTVCSECRAKVDDMTGYIPWPCPTITAMVAALGGGE